MKVLITGSSGLVGSALGSYLKDKGHRVFGLMREKNRQCNDCLFWDPEEGLIDKVKLEGFDVVIHLAGENIAGGLWTKAKKQRILDSRVKGTRLLAEALSTLEHPPKVFIMASAVGYYGNQGDTICTEDARNGTGFLAEVCRQWERASEPIKAAGIRTVILRFGIVLSKARGALARMLTPFKVGLGGVLGSGKQYMSWIAIDDILNIIQYVIENEVISGPINAVSPEPVTNKQFTKTLGTVLNRPTIIPAPAFALRLLLGKEMADDFLLSSTRAEPARLISQGYQFLYPELEEALRHLLKREGKNNATK